jgi:sugar O-acyltransferase (sialic acid O-acetyltransferase NeuD family)
MKNLLIIGARGSGREYYNGLKLRSDYGIDFVIKGFLDDKIDALDGYEGYSSIISSVEDYTIEENDIFICPLGDSKYRRKYIDIIRQKGGTFMNIISRKSIIHPTTSIGEGVMIGSFCNISSDVTIGDYTVIQSYTNLGHDAKVGEFCSIESFSFMGGFSSIGKNVTLHTRATILPHVKIRDNAIVGAGSVFIISVKENITVFGVPAKKVDY